MMGPFWIPIIIRPPILLGTQKGTIILTTNHIFPHSPYLTILYMPGDSSPGSLNYRHAKVLRHVGSCRR